MSTPLVVTQTQARMRRPTLRTITAAALVANALFFVPDLFSSGPNGLNLGHIIPSLVIAGIVASRFRWAPALGALYSALMLVDGYMFLTELALGGILSTAIQSGGVAPSVSSEVLAALPVLTAKDHLFDQPEIRARVGETVALR